MPDGAGIHQYIVNNWAGRTGRLEIFNGWGYHVETIDGRSFNTTPAN